MTRIRGVESLRWFRGKAISPFCGLPTMSPADDVTPLEHVTDSTFRRILEDGELGESYEFAEDADGQVVGMRYHSNTYPRMDLP